MKYLREQIGLLVLILACAVVGGVLPSVVTGCRNPTVQGVAVQTLGGMHATADAAYKSYCSAVYDHTAPTNDLPKVTRAYVEFQTAFALAVAAVQGNTNAVVPQPVYDAAARLTTAIQTAKGK